MKKVAKPEPEIGYVKPRILEEEMQESYLDYAMSVIVARALPDVRDGLKPVHRRILYAMSELGLQPTARYRKSATVVGECFVKDTLVVTTKGLVPIQNIKIGDLVFTQKGIQPVTCLYQMPPRPLLKITLANGISVTVTPSQKLKTFNKKGQFEWKEAKSLHDGAWMAVKSTYPDLPEVKLSSYNNTPKTLNRNLAYILGALISDGWIASDYSKQKYRRLGFCASEKSIAEKLSLCFREEFGYLPTIQVKNYTYHSKNSGVGAKKLYTVRINRKDINEYFIRELEIPENFKAATKCFPKKILVSPKEVIYAFISGLIDGDGSVNKISKPGIVCTSISERLITELQISLQHLGIFSTKYKQANIKDHVVGGRLVIAKSPSYTLEIRGHEAKQLAGKLTLASELKAERLNQILSANPARLWSNFGILPYGGEVVFSELSRLHLGSGWYQAANGTKFREGIPYIGGTKIRYSADLQKKPLRLREIVEFGIMDKLSRLNSPLAPALESLMRDNIRFLTIKKIENATPEKTYDIQVLNDHEFTANGIISHNCLGKYHPHGDVAVYDSLVRLAQDFAMRYPLVDGQGNFGSLDGDAPAAMRYSECRLASISLELLADLDKNTVNWMDNYDATRKEPVVMPARLPNLLLNGTLGIAVGMATDIPPHNLGEIVDATMAFIDNPKLTSEDLMEYVHGPDFPTGGIIYDWDAIKTAYATGKGGVTVRAKTEIIEARDQNYQILITEIPYRVNKAALLEKLADLIRDKKIETIKNLRDESDKDGVRIVVELKKDALPNKVLNQLFKYTQLQDSFHLNMLALVDGIEPRVLNLKMILEYYITHRREVIVRRTRFDLEKAKDRAHILEGLKKALEHIDAVIKTIKQSNTKEEAHLALQKKFKLSDKQATAILEMKLQALAGLERRRVEEELREKRQLIRELEELLKSPKRIDATIKKELAELKTKYGDARRTKLVHHPVGEFKIEDLIPNEEVIIVVTKSGYAKRLPSDTYRKQGRGGKGVIGITTKEKDVVEKMLLAQTHDDILFFTNKGRVFQTKVYELPEASRTAKGQALVNFLELKTGEVATAVLTFGKAEKSKYKFLLMGTKFGTVKKTAVAEFEKVRRSGLLAIKLKKDDELKWVNLASGGDQVMITTGGGQAIRFRETDVRPMGRVASGVRGIRLKKNDGVMSLDIIEKSQNPKDLQVLVISELGLGKKTNLSEYKIQHRGGSGIKTMNLTKKTGKIVVMQITSRAKEADLVVISKTGQTLRTALGQISTLGRATQGVRIIRLEQGDAVASATIV